VYSYILHISRYRLDEGRKAILTIFTKEFDQIEALVNEYVMYKVSVREGVPLSGGRRL
jgi:hypothetical protein